MSKPAPPAWRTPALVVAGLLGALLLAALHYRRSIGRPCTLEAECLPGMHCLMRGGFFVRPGDSPTGECHIPCTGAMSSHDDCPPGMSCNPSGWGPTVCAVEW